MRIYMIGAGAMGGVYGGLLTRAGYDVTLIDPRQDHIRKIQSEGITIEGMRGTHVIRLPAQCDSAGLAPADLAIIFTDANSTRDAARAARQLLKPDGFAFAKRWAIQKAFFALAEKAFFDSTRRDNVRRVLVLHFMILHLPRLCHFLCCIRNLTKSWKIQNHEMQ